MFCSYLSFVTKNGLESHPGYLFAGAIVSIVGGSGPIAVGVAVALSVGGGDIVQGQGPRHGPRWVAGEGRGLTDIVVAILDMLGSQAIQVPAVLLVVYVSFEIQLEKRHK